MFVARRSQNMSHLTKLTVKSVIRTNKQDPVQQRRQKLVAGIEEQLKVAKVAVKGENYEVLKKTCAKASRVRWYCLSGCERRANGF